MIGDVDPEDAYDAGDPHPVRLAVIARAAASIDADPDRDRAGRRRVELARLLRRIADELAEG